MKKMKKQKFPETLYVTRELDGGASYLLAHETTRELGIVGEEISVAVYKLNGRGKVVSAAELVKEK